MRDGEVGVNLADGAWHTVKIIMITILLFNAIIIMTAGRLTSSSLVGLVAETLRLM